MRTLFEPIVEYHQCFWAKESPPFADLADGRNVYVVHSGDFLQIPLLMFIFRLTQPTLKYWSNL